LLSSQFWPMPSMSRGVINCAKQFLSHPFSRRKLFDQWAVDREPVLTSTTSAKIGKTAIPRGGRGGSHRATHTRVPRRAHQNRVGLADPPDWQSAQMGESQRPRSRFIYAWVCHTVQFSPVSPVQPKSTDDVELSENGRGCCSFVCQLCLRNGRSDNVGMLSELNKPAGDLPSIPVRGDRLAESTPATLRVPATVRPTARAVGRTVAGHWRCQLCCQAICFFGTLPRLCSDV